MCKKTPLKRFLSATFALLLMLSAALTFIELTQIRAFAADNTTTIKVYYNRPDGNYDPWMMWSWYDGGEGMNTYFTEENGKMVTTREVESSVSSVGFIIHMDDWTKDVDADQFIDISEMVSGTVNIYVESGVPGYTKDYGEDAIVGIKVKSAKYNGDATVTVSLTGEADDEMVNTFVVSGQNGDVSITSVEDLGDNTYLLTLAEELNGAKSYSISFAGNTFKLIMPNFYSSKNFEDQYTYTGDDLGAVYSKEATSFRVWAPTADAVSLNLYASGTAGTDDLIESIPMTADVNGTWTYTLPGDQKGVYYTYSVEIEGNITEAMDPYARTTGVNGSRAMIIDLDATDPEGWDADKNPHAGEKITDAVIYELHVRDLSADASSGIVNTGKFLGLTETSTKNSTGQATGIDHISELGATHVHLLPMYDFGSVDESTCEGYNWGYDPVNYNVPEGSYSTDPYNGEVRVAEAKQMIKAMHDNGLSVVMDVVYNHVQDASRFSMNMLIPGYFSRITEDGSHCNDSGCGNTTASERSMVRKFIVDSVCYWADEYHMDGFRFDLVGLIDTETINEIVAEVHKTHPDVIFYGEGWSMSSYATKDGVDMATQVNSEKTPEFAYFNDSIRDGLKGSVFDEAPGFVSGKQGMEESMIRSYMAQESWSSNPSQIVNYVSCHDNNTLIDRIMISRPDASFEDQVRMNNLSAAFYMTAQGIPFFQAGEEMLRSKPKADGSFDHNSYCAGDEVNSIKWDNLSDPATAAVYEYYKGLISFRKAHELLRLATAEEVSASVTSIEGLPANVVAFLSDGKGETIFAAFNANEEAVSLTLPEGKWDVYVNGEQAGTNVLASVSGQAEVSPISALILVKASEETREEITLKAPALSNLTMGIKLKIEKIEGAEKYIVYRKLSDGKWKKLAVTTKTSFVDMTAQANGKQYEYKLVAVMENGEKISSESAVICRLTTRNLISAVNVSKNAISLKWAVNSKADGYEIQYTKTASYDDAEVLTVEGAKNKSVKLTGLDKKACYKVRIRSYKLIDGVCCYSAWSASKKLVIRK